MALEGVGDGVCPQASWIHGVEGNPITGLAGEATSREYAATVHGAYLSGLREAERIAGLQEP